MATATATRPSAYLSLHDEWSAYQLDYAVVQWGRYVERETADGKTSVEDVIKRKRGGGFRPLAASGNVRQVSKLPWDE